MANPKCPFCGEVMKIGAPFFDKFSGKYSVHAKCWSCGAQGPIAKSGSPDIAMNRAMKNAQSMAKQKPLRWAALDKMQVVWLEDADKKEVVPAFPEPMVDRDTMTFQMYDQDIVYSRKEDFGKRWRAWESLPTSRERKETAWKER